MTSIKEMKETIEQWYGSKVKLTNKIDNVFLSESAVFTETFSLKKVSLGEMTFHKGISSMLIACDFNKVRSVTNIKKVEYIEDQQKFILSGTEEGQPSKVELTIEKI